MNHFPLFDNLDVDKVNAISNTSSIFKQKFSGAVPFVRFISYQKGEVVIGNDTDYTSFKPGTTGYRFPPMVTGLEIKPGGSMGVLREGHITIKFPSMLALEKNNEFFRIGTPKAIVWGWTKTRSAGDKYEVPQGLEPAKAKTLVDNIDNWKAYCGDGSKDVMVGPLIDFSYTINNDASIDATFVVGTKNEIAAYLGTTKQSKTNTNSSTKDSVLDVRIARVLELENLEFLRLKSNSLLLQNTINYQYSNQNFFSAIASRISTWFDISVTTDHDAYSEDVYISMEFIAKYAINKNKGNDKNDYKLDIENACAASHPNIISNSENIIFPNATMANPIVTRVGDGGALFLETKNTQNFKLASGKEFPEQIASNKSSLKIYNNKTNNYEAGNWGYIKNIFLKVDFVLDVAKSLTENGKINDFVQKLCDEINLSACGLMELAPQPQSNSNSDMIYTIVDYALIPTIIPNPPSKINLFSDNTTITGINFTSDLPKEIISMAMLGNQKSREIGKKLFFSWQQDVTDILNLKSYGKPTASGSLGTGSGFTNIFGVGGYFPDNRFIPLDENGFTRNPDGNVPTNTETMDRMRFGGGAPTLAELTDINGTIIDDNCVIIHKDKKTMQNGDTDIRAVLKDTALCKNLYFGQGGVNKNNPLLPIELEITVMGISGITVGKIVDIDVPFDNSGIFQVTEVTHTIDSIWETKIKFRFRPNNR